MEKRDLLGDLASGRLTPKEAEDVYDFYMDNLSKTDPPAPEMMGFSKKEWTAYAHGAPFEVIAQWRTHEWPDKCFVCGKAIVSDDYGWFVRKHEGEYALRHIICPDSD
ncbi:hypothetical protein [Burkholderia cenocepacia]|uniref:hypothetical protein n=1 Tax=Burkholderia cenocepacia TaxID=95486 RepID=UPI000A4B4320|nr:hypothetical protein [Burkholderia cenocepacia]MBR7980694.1 hypothetical protein [Burkholderia cenocepacia]MBR7991708.1 hypothetical protein [Burkholderia cenocepacia]MBR8274771.1 hypothetical protein [Burkholderia cenocepacia]MBR8375745.1 hypothetical protein [Burkholderia cenocepacia]